MDTPPALRHAVELTPSNVPFRYFYLRNNSTIIAFRIGANVSWNTGGYKILGAHTDSPCLKMKPMSLRNAHGFVQAGVETYARCATSAAQFCNCLVASNTNYIIPLAPLLRLMLAL